MRIGQKIVNDILKDIKIDIFWCNDCNGFRTSVGCSKLFNMTDKTFKERYLHHLIKTKY